MSGLKKIPWLYGLWTLILGGFKAVLGFFKTTGGVNVYIDAWLNDLRSDMSEDMVTEIDRSVESVLTTFRVPNWVADFVGDVVSNASKSILEATEKKEQLKRAVETVAQSWDLLTPPARKELLPNVPGTESPGSASTYAFGQLIVQSKIVDVVDQAIGKLA